jgi:hypothetical protein
MGKYHDVPIDASYQVYDFKICPDRLAIAYNHRQFTASYSRFDATSIGSF